MIDLNISDMRSLTVDQIYDIVNTCVDKKEAKFFLRDLVDVSFYDVCRVGKKFVNRTITYVYELSYKDHSKLTIDLVVQSDGTLKVGY